MRDEIRLEHISKGVGNHENVDERFQLKMQLKKVLPNLSWSNVVMGKSEQPKQDLCTDIAIYLYNAFVDCRWFGPAFVLAEIAKERGTPLTEFVEVLFNSCIFAKIK